MTLAELAAQEAARQGLDPALVLRVMQQESGGRPDAVSPAGAIGPMQLMPGTARDLGVDPHDPAQNIRGGVTYLKQQMDRFGDPRLALAAYNAGPGRVERAGGIPNIPETQQYVAQTAPQGGGDIFDAPGAPSAAPPQASQSGEDIFADAPAGQSTVSVQPLPALSGQNSYGAPLADDTYNAGFAPQGQPSGDEGVLRNAGHATMEAFRKFKADLGADNQQTMAEAKGAPPGLVEAVQRSVGDLGRKGGLVADAVNIPGAFAGSLLNDAITQPLARGLDQIPLPAYQGPQLTLEGGHLGLTPMRQLDDAGKHQANVEAVATALMGARAPSVNLPVARAAALARPTVPGANLTEQLTAVAPSIPRAAASTVPTLDELRAQKQAAYKTAETSGHTISTKDARALAKDVAGIVAAKGGQPLYPTAKAMSNRLADLVKGGLTPTQLDDYRGQLFEQLMSDGGKEYQIGKTARARVDQVLDANPAWGDARALNTRYEKLRDVTNRIESADLAADTSGTGTNLNTTRQKLRPLIDPKSPQYMGNATPGEQTALRNAVTGSPGQNLARVLSAFDPFRGKLSSMLHAGAAVGTHGLTLAAAPVGMVATQLEKTLGQRNIERLVEVIANGGVAPTPAAGASTLTPSDVASALAAAQLGLPKPSRGPSRGSDRSGR